MNLILKLIAIPLTVLSIHAGKQRRKYLYYHSIGPHSFYSVINLNDNHFYLNEWTTGFLVPTNRTRRGLIKVFKDTLVLIPERTSFYVRARNGKQEQKVRCKCHTSAFSNLTATKNHGYADLCDTLRLYYKNDSLHLITSKIVYHEVK